MNVKLLHALKTAKNGRILGYSQVYVNDGEILTTLESVPSDFANYLYVDGKLVHSPAPSDNCVLTSNGEYVIDNRTTKLYKKADGSVYLFDGEYDGLGEVPDWLTDIAPSSSAYDWSTKTNDWVLNKTRAAALEAQAIKDAVPKIVSMVQAKCALLRFGLLDDVEAAMLTDAVPREAKIYWTGTTVRREDATVSMMAAMLKLTDAQVDDLFTLAATL